MRVQNHTDFPFFVFEKAGPHRERFDVLVVRGTFALADGEVIVADRQAPLVFGDEHDGPLDRDPLGAVLVRAGDLVPQKPGTDVLVTGIASSPRGRESSEWLAGVAIGPVLQIARLCGPRRFELGLSGWRLTAPEPTAAVALDHRLAFGGAFSVLAGGRVAHLYKEDNPAGRGWLPDKNALATLDEPARRAIADRIAEIRSMPAPQIEHATQPVRSPFDRIAARSFGPVARWWEPRTRYAGTLDERWKKERCPALPDDFDPRFYQCARPEMVCTPHLRGDETVALHGLWPEGERTFRLPGIALNVIVARARSTALQTLALDTVHIDIDRRELSLVWHATFDQREPIRDLEIVRARSSMAQAAIQSRRTSV